CNNAACARCPGLLPVPCGFLAGASFDHYCHSASESGQGDIRSSPPGEKRPAVHVLQTADDVFGNGEPADPSGGSVGCDAVWRASPSVQDRRASTALECAGG